MSRYVEWDEIEYSDEFGDKSRDSTVAIMGLSYWLTRTISGMKVVKKRPADSLIMLWGKLILQVLFSSYIIPWFYSLPVSICWPEVKTMEETTHFETLSNGVFATLSFFARWRMFFSVNRTIPCLDKSDGKMRRQESSMMLVWFLDCLRRSMPHRCVTSCCWEGKSTKGIGVGDVRSPVFHLQRKGLVIGSSV
jgi:hypothetical protein